MFAGLPNWGYVRRPNAVVAMEATRTTKEAFK
jgi:hypothetical protein